MKKIPLLILLGTIFTMLGIALGIVLDGIPTTPDNVAEHALVKQTEAEFVVAQTTLREKAAVEFEQYQKYQKALTAAQYQLAQASERVEMIEQRKLSTMGIFSVTFIGVLLFISLDKRGDKRGASTTVSTST